MVIDLILDRKDGKKYCAREFYFDCLQAGEVADEITRAMDYGTESDVKKALCNYIDEQEYNEKIKDYIKSKQWLY